MLLHIGKQWTLQRLGDLEVRIKMMRLPSIGLPAPAAASVNQDALRSLERNAVKVSKRMLDSIYKLIESTKKIDNFNQENLNKANHRLTFLQIQTDGLFRSVDLFMDALASRTDAEMGLLLAGVDQIISQALERPIKNYIPPRAVTYLDSATRGGAINRARTELPGGVVLPVAMVRVSPETLPTRLTSSLHEAGHQLSVDLGIMEEVESLIINIAYSKLKNRDDAELWGSWTGELLADVWAYGLGGGAPAVDGLQRVLSLPAPMLYQIRKNDPHPPGVIRIPFALSISRIMHPDPILKMLSQRHQAVYSNVKIPLQLKEYTQKLSSASFSIAEKLLHHRFKKMNNKSLAEVVEHKTVNPKFIRSLLNTRNSLDVNALSTKPPLTSLAMIGYARLLGKLSPAKHDQLSRAWLREMSRRSFLSEKSKSHSKLVSLAS